MIGKLLIIIRVMFILPTMMHMLCLLLALLLCMVEVGLGKIMLCIMCLGKCVIYLLLFSMLATLHLYFHVRMKKWLLENWDPNARETRLVFGFQKLL
jgi:membrane protein implicated in regulation of membrane protease activity